MEQPVREMPKYRSHKTVWALKIKDIEKRQFDYLITPEEADYSAFAVRDAYVTKHMPTIGGYYVRYADGYESFSPAQAFESGYGRIGMSECSDEKEEGAKKV